MQRVGGGATSDQIKASMAGGAQLGGHIFVGADRALQMLGSMAAGAASTVIDQTLGNVLGAAGPALLVFCGNNRRHRLLFEWRGRPFVNDYLDPFFNAAVDTGIALATFIAAADRVGLGTCPISQIRNHAAQVSDVLGLPQHVFPVAGLGVGWPSFEGVLTPRLGLDVSIHRDRYDETGLKEKVEAYDRRRNETQPYKSQRFVDKFGEEPAYGWSEDKARQYSVPERADFGAFVRAKGFNLD